MSRLTTPEALQVANSVDTIVGIAHPAGIIQSPDGKNITLNVSVTNHHIQPTKPNFPLTLGAFLLMLLHLAKGLFHSLSPTDWNFEWLIYLASAILYFGYWTANMPRQQRQKKD